MSDKTVTELRPGVTIILEGGDFTLNVLDDGRVSITGEPPEGGAIHAPEPAPIEVGDWYQNNTTGSVSVVTWVNPYQVTLRHIKGSSAIAATLRLRDNWTKLDGPPEPPPGSVYVIGRQVWQHTSLGHEGIGTTSCESWGHMVKTRYSRAQLATLRILGSVT